MTAAQEFGDRARSPTWFLEFPAAELIRAPQPPSRTPHAPALPPRARPGGHSSGWLWVALVASPEHGDPCPDSSMDSKCSVGGGEGSARHWGFAVSPPGLGGSGAHAGVVAVRVCKEGWRCLGWQHRDTGPCWDGREHQPGWAQGGGTAAP